MKSIPFPNKSGFTLVEIMIVVAIIALLVAVALPSLTRARKRTQAISVKEELRLIDSAIGQYALETNHPAGATVNASDIYTYMKNGSRLYSSLSSGAATDAMGNAITLPSVDNLPQVPSATYTALSDIAPTFFWDPYAIAGS